MNKNQIVSFTCARYLKSAGFIGSTSGVLYELNTGQPLQESALQEFVKTHWQYLYVAAPYLSNALSWIERYGYQIQHTTYVSSGTGNSSHIGRLYKDGKELYSVNAPSETLAYEHCIIEACQRIKPDMKQPTSYSAGNDFVSYEIALMCQALSYSRYAEYSYFKHPDGRISTKSHRDGIISQLRNTPGVIEIPAPNWDHVRYWITETFEVDIVVNPVYTTKGKRYKYDVYNLPDEYPITSFGYYENYAAALEAGMAHALNELVKSEQKQ